VVQLSDTTDDLHHVLAINSESDKLLRVTLVLFCFVACFLFRFVNVILIISCAQYALLSTYSFPYNSTVV
jgi:hypothetical protein